MSSNEISIEKGENKTIDKFKDISKTEKTLTNTTKIDLSFLKNDNVDLSKTLHSITPIVKIKPIPQEKKNTVLISAIDRFNLEIEDMPDWGKNTLKNAQEIGTYTTRKWKMPKAKKQGTKLREKLNKMVLSSEGRLPPPSFGQTTGHGNQLK